MELLKRPSSKDNEEDLFAFQDAFSSSQESIPAAAKAIRMKPNPIKSSSIVSSVQSSVKEQSSHIEIKDKSIHSIGGMIGDVVERDIDSDDDEDLDIPLPSGNVSSQKTDTQGFPKAIHRSQFSKSVNKMTKESSLLNHHTKKENIFDLFSGAESEFDKENIDRIANMTEGELEAAFAEISSRLDESSLGFFRKRAEQKYSAVDKQHKDEKPSFVYNDHTGVSSDSNLPVLTHDTFGNSQSMEKSQSNTLIPKPNESSSTVNNQLEDEKLEWTKDVLSESQIDKSRPQVSSLRFDFQGVIITADQDIPSHSGLYHHGEDQNEAGYTIKELLHLSRSTVPSQRAFALSRVSLILDNLNISKCFTSKQVSEIWSTLFQEDLLLHIRIGIDESNETVIAAALDCLASLVGASRQYSLWAGLVDDACLARNGGRVFGTSAQNIHDFRVKSSSFPLAELDLEDLEQQQSPSLDQIKDASKKDVISALLSMDILPRFRYLIQTKKIGIEQQILIIHILSRIAHHSPSSAHSVLAAEGLYDEIRSMLFATQIPISETLEYILVCSCLRLIRLAAQSSRMACQKMIEYGLFADLTRLMSCDDAIGLESSQQIFYQIWLILHVLFLYHQVGTSGFISYYSVLLKSFQSITSCISESRTISHMSLRCVAACFRALHSHLCSSYNVLQVGSVNDLLAPFVGVLVPVISVFLKLEMRQEEAYAALKSSFLDFLTEYFRLSTKFQVLQNAEFDVCLKEFKSSIMSAMPHITKSTVEQIRSITPFSCADGVHLIPERKGLGLLHEDRIGCAISLQNVSLQFDVLSALNSWVKANMKPQSALYVSIAKESFGTLVTLNEVNSSVSPDHVDWVRVFGKGFLYWLESVYSLYHGLRSVSSQIWDEHRDLMIGCAYNAATSCLPGDETIASKLINAYLFHDILVGTDLDESLLKSLFAKQLYSMDSLKASQAFYNRDSSFGGPSTLFIELDPSYGSLPLRHDWIFTPIERAFNAYKRDGSSHMTDEVIRNVLQTMKLVQRLESSCTHFVSDVNDGMKLAHFMTVFLLSDKDKNELYFRDSFEELLRWGLYTWATDDLDLDKACGGQGRFFNFYQEFLRHFVSTSYGFKVFAQYVVLPLNTKYATDYRTLFWSSVVDIVRSIDLNMDDMKWLSFESFTTPPESDSSLRGQCQTILRQNATVWNDDPSNPAFLKRVLECHFKSE